MSNSLQAMLNGMKLPSIKKLRTYYSTRNTIKLPSAKELEKRFRENGFGSLVDWTQIDVELGDKELYPLDIVKAIEAYVYTWEKYRYPTLMTKEGNQMYTEILITRLFKDSPEELAELLKQFEEANAPGSRE